MPGVELRKPRGLHRRAIDLADQLHQEAAYDAHYLSLADIMGCDLWTADERFYRTASPSFKLVKWIGEIEVGHAMLCGWGGVQTYCEV